MKWLCANFYDQRIATKTNLIYMYMYFMYIITVTVTCTCAHLLPLRSKLCGRTIG